MGLTRSERTDDRGQFRLRALPPGRYSVGVEATYGNEQESTYYTTYAPGTPVAPSAAWFDVGAGDVIGGVVIAVDQRTGQTVSGLVRGLPRNRRLPEAWLLVAGSDDVRSPLPFGRTRVNDSGQFKFAQVPPGSYVVRIVDFPEVPAGTPVQVRNGEGMAFPQLPGFANRTLGPTFWGESSVGVDRTDISVTVDVVPGGRILGSVAPGGNRSSLTSEIADAFLLVVPVDGRTLGPGPTPLTPIARDGTFETAGLPPGRYALMLFPDPRSTARGDWWIDSLKIRGVRQPGIWVDVGPADVTGVDVVVATTSSSGTLRGSVRDEHDQPTGAATVYVFPADPRWWQSGNADYRRSRAIQVSPLNGTYTVEGLPAGTYHVIAIEGGAREDWNHGASLSDMSIRAERVTVGPGETVALPLVVKRVRTDVR